MERAVSILCEAVDTGKKIRIVGDYDIDGVCSTYILLQAFERLGSDVDFEIPDRIKDGYGINESIIEQAHADGVEVIRLATMVFPRSIRWSWRRNMA